MHPNPDFRQTEITQSLDFVRSRGFGILTLNGADQPLLAHVPVLLAEDGTSLDLHLARSNPIARAVKAPRPVLVAVSGPDAYISPDWYGEDDLVPTWNYIAVHLIGELSPLPETDLQDMLVRQSHQFESRLAPKPEWLIDKLSADQLMRLKRMILPFRLTITDVQSTFKLSQNRTPAARLGAADGLAASGQPGAEVLANLMRRQ